MDFSELISKAVLRRPALLVFSVVRESFRTLAAIVKDTEIRGYRNDRNWHLGQIR
jgi:hypothetical protein